MSVGGYWASLVTESMDCNPHSECKTPQTNVRVKVYPLYLYTPPWQNRLMLYKQRVMHGRQHGHNVMMQRDGGLGNGEDGWVFIEVFEWYRECILKISRPYYSTLRYTALEKSVWPVSFPLWGSRGIDWVFKKLVKWYSDALLCSGRTR